MYTNLLAKQQFKNAMQLWRKHQLQLVSASTMHNGSNSYTGDTIRNLTTTPFQGDEVSLVKQHLTRRLYSLHEGNGTKPKAGKAEEGVVENTTEEVDFVAQNFDFKLLMYDGDDDIMKMFNKCDNSKEVQILFENLGAKLSKEHIVQTIILLWMFSKQCNTSQRTSKDKRFLYEIITSLQGHMDSLSLNEMSTCYLYLRKMGIDNTEPLMEKMLMEALRQVETSVEFVGLPALSRLVVGINAGKDFFTPMLCACFMRHLEHHVATCTTGDDARMVAICMLNLQFLITDDIVNSFKDTVGHLIRMEEVGASNPMTVIKILNMLNMGVWSHKHATIIRELLLSVKPVIKSLEAKELKNICRIYQHHMEPACIHKPLADAVEELLATNMSPESLACFVPFAQPQKRESLINALKALLSSSDSWQQPNAMDNLFYTLRGLKVSDTKICDAYWNAVVNELDATAEENIQMTFLKHCHRYMNFNNNLGGTYRHKNLEKKLSQLCMRAIEHDVAGRIPQTFARLASFVLAYGHTPYSWKKYPNILLSKIINMVQQFTPIDCFVLSRGLQISLEMRYRHQVPQLVNMQLATIDSVLTTCVERYLNDNHLSVNELNMLVRTLSNRKSLKNSVVYHRTLEKYKEINCHELNSRVIKDMAYNFMTNNYIVPQVLDAMFKYVETYHNHVVGETVEKLLSCTYNLGYTPESNDALQYAGLILLRDFDYMSGLVLVQACLALCYYKTIPDELINKVFCVKFIQRVEDEIQLCYSKATYPERVLNVVMQLNRSVCLDYPEANVPWFQQSFIEAQISKRPPITNAFGCDVKTLLSTVLKDDSYFRCNHTTPYGYQIDFVINFDKDKKPIKAPAETAMLDRITKVAILLLKLDSFCTNDLNALRGPDSLKIKHLEMMGYKVLHINEHDWNSKYMNIPGAKTNYLKCLLQISS